MDINEMRQKNKNELRETLSKLRKEYQDVVADVFQHKEKNVRKPGSMRRNIARLKTVIREKEILAEEATNEDK